MDDVGGLVLLKYGQGLALAEKGRDTRRSIFYFAKTIFNVIKVDSLFKSYMDRKSFLCKENSTLSIDLKTSKYPEGVET
jgi:hypothetical protein